MSTYYSNTCWEELDYSFVYRRVNFTQTWKLLPLILCFWTRNILWPLSCKYISKIASILPGQDADKISFAEEILSAFIWFLQQYVLKVYWQYSPTCPRCIRDMASSKNKLLRKLSILLFFPKAWLKDFKEGLVSKQRF